MAIAPNTLRTYLRDYREGGIEKLKEINFYRPQSELEEYRTSLEDYFQKNPPATINEAAISNCLAPAHLKQKKELDSLLSLKFQTFNRSQILKIGSRDSVLKTIAISVLAISKRSAPPRLRRAAAPSGGNGGSNKTGLTSDTNSSITL